jgi:hypothetical protein
LGIFAGSYCFVGLGQSIRGTAGNALIQSYTQPAYMGRVMSIMMMQFGFMSLCTFFAGVIAEVVPVQWVLGSLAMMLVLYINSGYRTGAANPEAGLVLPKL